MKRILRRIRLVIGAPLMFLGVAIFWCGCILTEERDRDCVMNLFPGDGPDCF